MNTEKLGLSRIMNLLAKPGGKAMESGFRRRLQNPRTILEEADLKSGQTILEVGSGTGFFTLDAADMITKNGRLIAMDPLSDFVTRLQSKVQDAGLTNVEVVQRDALKTGLDANMIDVALLFGVVPFPTLPLNSLLPEMYRVLKSEGTMAVWLFPTTAGVPRTINRSGLFKEVSKKNRVYIYSPITTRKMN